MLKQMDLAESVIPGLTRNPVGQPWIPAFAGMTWQFLCFGATAHQCTATYLMILLTKLSGTARHLDHDFRRNDARGGHPGGSRDPQCQIGCRATRE